MTSWRTRGFALLAPFVLAACAQPVYVAEELATPTLPVEDYQDAAERGVPVYRIDPIQSLILIHVGRAGAMKNIGHDHVIASEDVEGMIMVSDDPSASRADLRLPLQRLIVDNADYRTRLGLAAEVSASAINGTTGNMQDKVLESSAYPWAEVRALIASVHDQPTSLSVSVTLHGTTFDYLVPVELELTPERLSVAGRLSIQHSDFGLQPFSAAAGLLRVAGKIDIEFDIVALAWVEP